MMRQLVYFMLITLIIVMMGSLILVAIPNEWMPQ